MTFSLISVTIILITALVITIEVLKAIKRGLRKTLITLASLFLTIFSSIVITNFLSRPFTNLIMSRLNLDFSSMQKTFASANDIAYSYFNAMLAPIVFLMVFFVMRILIAIVLKIIEKSTYKKISDTQYQSEDAPNYKKKPTIINGLLGAFCGFIIMVVCISPIFGSLKVGINAIKRNDEKSIVSIPFDSSLVGYIDACSKDIAGNIIYYCGGNLVYRSVATSTLNDNHFSVIKEIDESFDNYESIISLGVILNDLDAATPEMKESAGNFGDNVNKAETLKTLSYDVFPKLAKSWLDNKPYSVFGASWSKPNINGACESFFNKMLNVCRQSTPDTVGEDFTTLINVYIIAHEKGILLTENYKEMVEKANDTGALELIRQELSKNPRMSGISLETDSMGIKSLASALKTFNIENYDGLMNNITNMLNYSMNYTDENQLTFVKNNLSALINNYGIRAGQDIIDSVSDELINDVMRGKSSVSVEDIREFWDKYSVVTDTNTSTQPQTTPPAENSNEPSENEEPENKTPENETPENETPENETSETGESGNESSENEDVDSGEGEKETLNTFF